MSTISTTLRSIASKFHTTTTYTNTATPANHKICILHSTLTGESYTYLEHIDDIPPSASSSSLTYTTNAADHKSVTSAIKKGVNNVRVWWREMKVGDETCGEDGYRCNSTCVFTWLGGNTGLICFDHDEKLNRGKGMAGCDGI